MLATRGARVVSRAVFGDSVRRYSVQVPGSDRRLDVCPRLQDVAIKSDPLPLPKMDCRGGRDEYEYPLGVMERVEKRDSGVV